MSLQSKAKRDARKKKDPKRPIRRLGDNLQPHAQLTDDDGDVLGGAGWRDNQWLTVLAGKVVARTDSAAMTLAMLRHVVATQALEGISLQLSCSPQMQAVAEREAIAAGRTLEAYLAALEQERRELRGEPDGMAH